MMNLNSVLIVDITYENTQKDKKWIYYTPDLGLIKSYNNSEFIVKNLQFTGLKDKNDLKEVYEGDVVVYHYKNGNMSGSFEIKWGEEEHGWLPICEPADGGYEWDAQNDEDLEVIGNIYENPELIN